ncbi:hypothetical protein BDR04DRAFT_1018992, partial [Suillus decipiens]
LLCFAHYKPTLFLDGYSHCLEEYHDLPVSLAIIHASFKCVGLNIKWVQKLASKCNPIVCAAFVHQIGQYLANYLISLNEVSKDDRTYVCTAFVVEFGAI